MERIKCNLTEIQQLESGTLIEVVGLVKNIQTKKRTNGEDYIFLTICDNKTELSFPIWDDVKKRLSILEEGILLKIVGAVHEYNESKQIKVDRLILEKMADNKLKDYIPSYEFGEAYIEAFQDILISMIHLENKKYKEFTFRYLGINENIANKLIDKLLEKDVELSSEENAFEEHILYLIPKDSKFYKLLFAPAAIHHHQNKIGGCLLHTAGVLNNVVNILSTYVEKEKSSQFAFTNDIINKDRLIMSAILHDIEKTTEYEWKKGIKRSDSKFAHRLLFIKESERINDANIVMTGKAIFDDKELSEIQELVLTHHGPWGGYKPKTLEGLILFCADLIDANVASCVENNSTQVDMKLTRMIDSE